MQTMVAVITGALLVAFAYVVFHHVVARDYRTHGRLRWRASSLQLLVFVCFFGFPFQYMPSDWVWDWLPDGTPNRLVALVLVGTGMLVAFGTMIVFGLRRAFGVRVEGIVNTGVYRYTRNPQMIGGWLMVLGVVVYQPAWYGVGWALIWAVIGHWMIRVEEEHLHRVFGEAYERYCHDTPRYILRRPPS